MNADLRAYVDRFVNLIEEAEANREDQKESAKQAKNDGFDAPTIKRLAALVVSYKKAAKKRAENQQMELYNRESGLGLDLGLDESDRAGDVGAPVGGAGRVAPAAPPDAIAKSEARPTLAVASAEPAPGATPAAS